MRAVLVLAGLALAGCAPEGDDAASASAGAPAAPRHVVLVSLDTTRADHLGCYDGPVATPSLDRVAAEGVRFADVSTPATTTLCAHTSIFTGTWPQTHGVVRNGYVVPAANETLGELLDAAGFETAGFVSSFALDEAFGLAAGFDTWEQTFDLNIRAGDEEANQRRAEGTTDAVIAYLDAVGDDLPERLFLFVHYFDPHAPYDPPEPWRSRHGPIAEGVDGGDRDLRRIVAEHQEAVLGVPRDRNANVVEGLLPELVRGTTGEPRGIDRDLARLYAGEVAYMDHHVGRLFEALRERGLWDDALVVVTADHGETFWEHADFWNHGLATYQTTVHVPLLLRFPGARDAGSVVEQPVSTVDVAPTVLAALGLERPAAMEGSVLLPWIQGARGLRGPVFAIGTQPGAAVERDAGAWRNRNKAHAIREGRWKYVCTPYLGLEELYDLESDPDERRDLLAAGEGDDPDARARADELCRRLAAFRAAADPHPTGFLDHTRDQLQQMGYLEAGEGDGAEGERGEDGDGTPAPDGPSCPCE